MFGLMIVATGAVAQPVLPPSAASLPNPRAAELFEREPMLMAWGLRQYDLNGDGWLSTFEASRAADAFRALADTDHDGRVTMTEYREAVAYIVARF